MSRVAIFDTSIFIDYLRAGRHQDKIEQSAALIRNSSVVLSELWRGATKSKEYAFLRLLEKNYPVLTPSEKNWLESGQLLGTIYRENGFSPEKSRNLHFDVLIVLTAGSYGARVVASAGIAKSIWIFGETPRGHWREVYDSVDISTAMD